MADSNLFKVSVEHTNRLKAYNEHPVIDVRFAPGTSIAAWQRDDTLPKPGGPANQDARRVAIRQDSGACYSDPALTEGTGGMETAAHFALKGFAMALLHQLGCRAIAAEVRCPISRYRIDVAGWQDIAHPGGPRDPKHQQRYPQRCEPRTIFVECKQSRADFLRDRRQAELLLSQREMLQRQKHEIEERELKRREPELRRAGDSLFPGLDEWDFSQARSPKYRQVLAEISKLEKQLAGSTKFWYLAQHRLADQMFLAAPAGMIAPQEVPTGWGLAICPAELLENPPRRFTRWPEVLDCVALPAPLHKATEAHRQRVLRNIAVAATFASTRWGPVRQPSASPAEP